MKGTEQNPEYLRIEILSEHDYFFLYKHEYYIILHRTRPLINFDSYRVDEKQFKEIKKQLKLKVDFPEYATLLIKQFNNAIKEPSK